MKTKLIFLLLLHSWLAAQTASWEEPVTARGEDLEIILLTFGQGDNLTDWFGHTALAVRDTAHKMSRVYNFGLYSFEEGFVRNFIFGRLIFWGGDAGLSSTIIRYSNAGRSIYVQELNLDPAERLELARELAFQVRPENAAYLYHHYYENCSTRLRDMIDRALNGQFANATKVPGRQTFREHTIRYTDQSALMQWLLLFLMNDTIDKPIQRWDEMFLPDELMRNVAAVSYENTQGDSVKLERAGYFQKEAPNRPPVPEQADSTPLWTLVAGLLWAGLIVLSRIYNRQKIVEALSALSASVFGFLGTVLFFMAFFTDHEVTQGNENLIFTNPLTFLLAVWCWIVLFRKKTSRLWPARLWVIHGAAILLVIVLKLLPAFDQDNRMALMLLAPPYLALAWAWLQDSGWLQRRAE